MRIDLTATQIASVVAMLADMGESDDVELRADMLEGETNLHEVASKILAAIEHEDGVIAALKSQIDDRQIRSKAASHRKDVLRGMIVRLMEAGQLDKLLLPEATLSLRQIAPKRVVTDAGLLPDGFVKIERKPDMEAIKSAPEMPLGVGMDNGGQSLTVRRK